LTAQAAFPEICVLIPFYNNLSGLKAALKSIVYKPQRLTVLIVDDGSALPLEPNDLEGINPDLKFEILRLPKNAGITKALNTGLEWIIYQKQFRYIARLDCGDICTENRFYEQINFLENNPEIALVGSWCIFRNPFTGFFYNYITPTEHEEIIKELHYRNVFIHPTVVFRPEVINKIGLYPENYEHVEDYAFFMKIANQYKTAVLPEFLVTCEINPAGISIANRNKQLKGRAKVVADFGKSTILKKLGLFKLGMLQLIPYSFILKLKKFRSIPSKA